MTIYIPFFDLDCGRKYLDKTKYELKYFRMWENLKQPIAQWHYDPTKMRGGVSLYIHMLCVLSVSVHHSPPGSCPTNQDRTQNQTQTRPEPKFSRTQKFSRTYNFSGPKIFPWPKNFQVPHNFQGTNIFQGPKIIQRPKNCLACGPVGFLAEGLVLNAV